MERVSVMTARPYDAHIGSGALADAGRLAADRFGTCRAAIVADDIVARIYADALGSHLRDAGFETSTITFPAGERSKDLSTLSDVVEAIARAGLTRSDAVFALGGGVTGDLAGFAASCYMRGIKYVQIPTSLLAMVDSSVGGKTAVDLAAGKNLCGAFHQPELVVCDTDVLATLPEENIKDGLGEIVKYGMGFDASIMRTLAREGERAIGPRLIAACIGIKARVVAADERESGERQKLNLGHTSAHAIELLSDFSISHGRAVAIGTMMASRASAARGYLDASAADELESVLRALDMESECRYGARDLAHGASLDKKARGGDITLVMPTSVGECGLFVTPRGELERFFADALGGAR